MTSASETTDSVGPIVWALDPFASDEDYSVLLRALGSWRARGKPAGELIPVSVIPAVKLNWPVEYVAPMEEKAGHLERELIRPVLEKNLGRMGMSEAAIRAVRPEIVLHPGASKRSSAMMLAEFAKAQGASLIAVKTHGLKGLKRLWLGSFAESLVTLSSVPVITVNPDLEPGAAGLAEVSAVLVPTDLSETVDHMLPAIVSATAHFRPKIFLFHVHREPIPLFYDGGLARGADLVLIEELSKSSEKESLEKGQKSAQRVRELGYECEFVMTSRIGTPGELIVEAAASHGAGLIAMAATHGPMGQRLLGGTVHEVLSSAKCPVVVVHAT
jgi:nucleotide-binding universal stress UspA family protein